MLRLIAFFLCLLTSASLLPAQFLSFGIKGGVPITSPYGPSDTSHRYLVGPSLEVRLPAGFAVEAGALYQRTGYDAAYFFSVGEPTSLVSARTRGNSWQFPLLGKYYFRRRRAFQPFAGTGYAFRATWIHIDGISTTTSAGLTTTQPFSSHGRTALDVGAMVALGVRWRAARHLNVLPEFRYNRWGTTDFQSRRNTVAFLLGFSF